MFRLPPRKEQPLASNEKKPNFAIVMVDHLRDEISPLRLPAVEGVLPEVSIQTEVMATRAVQRLYLRRWLVAVCGAVILAFVLFFQLPPIPAALGFAVIAASAAFLRREGLLRSVRHAPRADSRPDLASQLSALLDGLPWPAVLLTARGQVTGYNQAAKEFLPGLKQGQHISGAIRDPRLLDAVANPSADMRQTVQFEERVPIHRHIEATVAPIARSGEPRARDPIILLSLRDLTEQERLDRLRSDFIANASHELRTPLASLLGFIDTLQGAAKNDVNAQQRFLAIMGKQAERMARLIDNLLSLSRVEMRQHLRPQAHIDLAETLRHVLATLEPLAAAARVTVHMDPVTPPAIILGDRDELVQVFSNLLQNAMKYGRTDGNVWISVTPLVEGGARRFAVSVRDDGPGIASEHLPRLTERFYRAGANGGEKAGTGLGLAIVKHAVARHRGELRISSTVGEGSTFTVLLNEAPPR
jgi:two-component system phosphate regulon sensor histidine kinase PhoR